MHRRLRLRSKLLVDTEVIQLHERDAALVEEARTASRLVRAIQQGDSTAETEMIERYSRGIGYLLTRRCGDAERARDLLHDSFAIAIEKLRTQQIDKPERLAGYLRGIAIRVAMNDGRRKQREPLPLDNDEIVTVPDNSASQFQHIDSIETGQAVREMLGSLAVERDRDLLIRFYVYDQDRDEICRALNLDRLHFNRVLYRAKQRFRKLIEEARGFRDLATRDIE